MKKNFVNYPFSDFFNVFDIVESTIDNLNLKMSNISEDEKQYSILVSVPGLTKDEINISIDEKILSVSHDDDKSIKKNCFTQSFRKTYRLSDDTDIENISAKLENGLLEIIIPKIVEKKSKKTIEIK